MPEPAATISAGPASIEAVGISADTTRTMSMAHGIEEWVKGAGTAAAETPVGKIRDYRFEVDALPRDIAEGYETLVRS